MDADFSPMSNAAGALAARGERLASHRDGRGAPGSPTRQPRWGPRHAGKARRRGTGAPAARGLRGGVAIPGVFERGATQPAPGSPTRQPRWGGLGMHRLSNAARLSPRAVTARRLITAAFGRRCRPPHRANMLETEPLVLTTDALAR